MGKFVKYDDLPETINTAIATFNLSSCYSIINLNSNVNVRNTSITNFTPSLNINNGKTNFIDITLANVNDGDAGLENGTTYIDNLWYNDNKLIYVEKGSLYPYMKISAIPSTTIMSLDLDKKLLIHPTYKNGHINLLKPQTSGTGNEWYSTHFLNNGVMGYWGNDYAGEIIKDLVEIRDPFTNELIVDRSIVLSSADLNLFVLLSNLPRNLNGYTVNIKVKRDLFNYEDSILIKNFYNGTLILDFFEGVNVDTPEENQIFTISNNNILLYFKFKDIQNFKFIMNDNKYINFAFNGDVNSLDMKGSNNIIDIYFDKTVAGTLSFFKSNSYLNKIIIDNKASVNLTNVINQIQNNKKIYGNHIVVKSSDDKIGELVNDVYNGTEVDISKYTSETINEVHMKLYRDATDVGSIIGWNAELAIPRGYYKCDGREVAVDIHNPNDLYYNGQLAWLMNGNLLQKTIKLPNIPEAYPTINNDDINYSTTLGSNFRIAKLNQRLVYIIKYNNNFENIKEFVSVDNPDQAVVPEPTPTPTPSPTPIQPTRTIVSGVTFVYKKNDKYEHTTGMSGNLIHQKVYKDYGGEFDRTCTLKIPRQSGDTVQGSKYVLSSLLMISKAHGHWVDVAAYTLSHIYLNNATIDMCNKIIYNCKVNRRIIGTDGGADDINITTTHTKTDPISINNLNFIDLYVEQTHGGDKYCKRWSNTKASAYADNEYIYIILHAVCHSDRGALENNIWYTDISLISNTICLFYKNN